MVIIMEHAGLIFDDSSHYLDHLAPFCASVGWPLIVCEPRIAALARRYYPGLQTVETDLRDLVLPRYLISCEPSAFLQAAFPRMRETTKTLWLPHGNSDKGWKKPFFEALQEGETALVYGQKMVDFIERKNRKPRLIRVGNFRWRYFLKNELFYRGIAQEEIGPFRHPTYLYAPTWEDLEDNGSFWGSFPRLTEALPQEADLLVKLHPNTQRRYGAEIEILIGRYAHKKNLRFLPEFPPIYALLSLCSAYIGDMSSIGYDFLRFDKPMFFLPSQSPHAASSPSGYLYRCGAQVSLDALPSLFQSKETAALSSIRREVDRYTFDDSASLSAIGEILL